MGRISNQQVVMLRMTSKQLRTRDDGRWVGVLVLVLGKKQPLGCVGCVVKYADHQKNNDDDDL